MSENASLPRYLYPDYMVTLNIYKELKEQLVISEKFNIAHLRILLC